MRVCWLLVLVGCGFTEGSAPNDATIGSSHHDAPGPHSEASPVGVPRLQEAESSSGNGNVVSVMLTGSVSAGDIELVLVTWQVGAEMLVGVSDMRGTGYTTLVQPYMGGFYECALLWERVTMVNSPDMVTASFSNSVNNRIAVAEYTNVPAAGLAVFDGNAATAISGSASIMASITTAHSNDMLVALVGASATPAMESGFTEDTSTPTSLIEQEVSATPGSYTVSASFNSGQNACLGLAAVLGIQ